jgi:hypothetical protein
VKKRRKGVREKESRVEVKSEKKKNKMFFKINGKGARKGE